MTALNDFIKKTASIGWIIFCIIFVIMSSYSLLASSEKIKDENQLKILLNEEASKLGLDTKKISIRFGQAEGDVGDSRKYSNGTYEIVLDNTGRNRETLRHELYHIYRDNFESGNLSYWFVEEPGAMIYESLGIKIQ